MTMTLLQIAVGLVAGTASGLLFFRLLWWSTHRAVHSERPVAIVAASFVARSVLMVGFFAIALYWAPVAGISAAAGFLVARRLSVNPVRRELTCD